MEEEFTDLFMMETDEEKTRGKKECKATGMIVVLEVTVGQSFPWSVCLNFSCLKVA